VQFRVVFRARFTKKVYFIMVLTFILVRLKLNPISLIDIYYF
jgi:hypothetical protein